MRAALGHAARRAVQGRSSSPTSAASPTREIASMLDTPIGTVKGRMRLGLEKMRGQLGGLAEVIAMSACAHRDDVGSYVLRALPEDEHERFEAHLATCEECRRDVAELQVVADTLPLAAAQVAPPPELRDRIMATVRSEAELLGAAGRARRPARASRPRRRRAAQAALVALAAPAAGRSASRPRSCGRGRRPASWSSAGTTRRPCRPRSRWPPRPMRARPLRGQGRRGQADGAQLPARWRRPRLRGVAGCGTASRRPRRCSASASDGGADVGDPRAAGAARPGARHRRAGWRLGAADEQTDRRRRGTGLTRALRAG